MKYVRRVHPLCWFLLVLFGFMIFSLNYLESQNVFPSREDFFVSRGLIIWVDFSLLINTLLIVHLAIYLMGLCVKTGKGFYWFSLFVQLGLILELSQLTSFLPITWVLLPVLLIHTTIMLRRIRAFPIALGSYLACLLQQEQGSHEHTKALLQKLDIAHAQLATYALHVEELTMITERQRIARDLHDTLVQGVAGLVMQMNVVQAHLQHQRAERAQELLEQVMESARDTLADARCAIGELRTACIRPDDLIEVVQEEINRFYATTQIACSADLALLARTPAPFCEHVLRAITEGLTNVARHAHAHTVQIHVTQCGEVLTVEVCDDGIGFDPALTETQIGQYGLLGMRERAKLIEGYLEIESAKNVGTTLRVHIPVPSVQQREGASACLSPFGSSSPMTI